MFFRVITGVAPDAVALVLLLMLLMQRVRHTMHVTAGMEIRVNVTVNFYDGSRGKSI